MERGAGGRLNRFSTEGIRNPSVLPVPEEIGSGYQGQWIGWGQHSEGRMYLMSASIHLF
jgi:hypothetical protein